MPDRIDREIEEILARLGEDAPKQGEEPISLEDRRRRRSRPMSSRAVAAFGFRLKGPTPASMLFAGAGVMVAGLILSAIWGALIWLAFGGVVLFVRAPAPAAGRLPARLERGALAWTLRRVRAAAARSAGADQARVSPPPVAACAFTRPTGP